MATRTTAVGNFSAGDILTDAHVDSLAAGWLGYVEKVTDTTGIVGSEVTILTVNPTFNANRYIRITAYYPSWISTVAADRAQMRLLEGATQLMLGRSFEDQTGVATAPPSVLQRVLVSPSAGSHTYSMTMSRNSGTGSLTLSGGTDGPAFLLVEDIGSSV